MAGVLAALGAAGSKPAWDKPSTSAETARLVARNLPRLHISHRACDDRVAASALDILLTALDYDRVYFLQSDIDGFRHAVTNLDDAVREGQVDFAYGVYEVLKERVSNRVDYVDALLAKGFDFAVRESFDWKRKDAPWAADEAAWNELWRKRIKNQVLARVVADKLAAESGEKAAALTAGEDEPTTASKAEDAKLSPEEFVRKSYRQYQTVLNDNDPEWIVERYLTSFTQAYDPHSDYMSANNTEDFDISMKLSLVGIGALLGTEDGAAKIERLIPGGPAERDGRLKPGDKIIAVAQGDKEPVDILHWPLSKAVRLIRGEKNTKVVLTVIRASDPTGSTIDRIDLIRDEVKLEEQAAKGEVREIAAPDGTPRRMGVIKLPEFYADMKGGRFGREARRSSRDVETILAGLATQNVEGVVLDLRNNGGGLLAEAIDMTGLFIRSGPVVQVSNGESTEVLSDVDPSVAYAGPLVVLVNRQTASASEILAAALQDYGRAVIVGDTKTHGKGTVQSLTSVKLGSPELGTLKVTTASFYRIAGGSTQLRGVAPDIVIPSLLDSMEIGEEHLPNAMAWNLIFPALYKRSLELDGFLPILKSKSQKRQAEDPLLSTYRDLVDQFAERQKQTSISLNLAERLDEARAERKLQKMIEDADKEEPKEGEEKKPQDLLLSEALSILSDLVSLENALEPNVADAGRPAGVSLQP